MPIYDGTPAQVMADWIAWADFGESITVTGHPGLARLLSQQTEAHNLPTVIHLWTRAGSDWASGRGPWPAGLLAALLSRQPAIPPDGLSWALLAERLAVGDPVPPPYDTLQTLFSVSDLLASAHRWEAQVGRSRIAVYGARSLPKWVSAWGRGSARRPALSWFRPSQTLGRQGRIRWAPEVWRPPAGDTIVAVSPDAVSAARYGAMLTARGIDAALPDATHSARWLTAWDAATPSASAAAVCLWDALSPDGPSLAAARLETARAGSRRAHWAASLAERMAALRDAGSAVLAAAAWAEWKASMDQLALTADLPPIWPDHGWSVLDRVGLSVVPEAWITWLRAEGDDTGATLGAGMPVVAVDDLDGWYDWLLWLGEPRPSGAVQRILSSHGRHVSVIDDWSRWPRMGESAWRPDDPGCFPPGAVPSPSTVTGLERYGRCPLQAAWEGLGVAPLPLPVVEPDPALLGRWAHKALEILGGTLEGSRDPVDAVRHALEEARRGYPEPPDTVPEALSGALQSLADDLTWLILWRPPRGRVQAEVSFTLEVDDAPIRGRIDRLEEGRDGVVMAVDYKTGARLPSARRVIPSRLQLPLYAKAAETLRGVETDRVAALYWGVRRVSGYAEEALAAPLADRWAEALDLVRGIRERARAGQFYPWPEDASVCRRCDFREACPVSPYEDRGAIARRHPAFVRLWEREPSAPC